MKAANLHLFKLRCACAMRPVGPASFAPAILLGCDWAANFTAA
jgi:hypothetical protein